MTEFQINLRPVLETVFGSVLITKTYKNKTHTRKGLEKVIPRVVEYEPDGSYKVIGINQLLEEFKPSKYYAGNEDFNQDRIATVHSNEFYKHFEHFPTLLNEVIDGKEVPHTFSELIYSQIVYLRPSPAVFPLLSGTVLQSAVEKSKILEKFVENYNANEEYKLDLHSVPKKDVGSFAYIAGKNGSAALGRAMNFGLDKFIPPGRLMREVSSLHAAERFIDPIPTNIGFGLDPYFTLTKVAVITPKNDFLDTGYITYQGENTFACKLETLKSVPDVFEVPPEDLNMKIVVNKGSMNFVHIEHNVINERESSLGTIRLVMPGGIKIAASPVQIEAGTLDEQVDIVLDFNTFARKGAKALFWWSDPKNIGVIPTEEDIENSYKEFVENPDTIFVNGVAHNGKILHIPMCRAGQRYTNLCKPTKVSTDLVAHAILNKPMTVSSHIEKTYLELTEFRNNIEQLILT